MLVTFVAVYRSKHFLVLCLLLFGPVMHYYLFYACFYRHIS